MMENKTAAGLRALKVIWDCNKITVHKNADNKEEWKCAWCLEIFGTHQERPLYHVSKISGGDIATCTARISDNYWQHNLTLFSKREAKERRKDATKESESKLKIPKRQLQSCCKKKRQISATTASDSLHQNALPGSFHLS